MYGALHGETKIELEIDESQPLKATTAAVLQALINLVDNATYWLLTTRQEPRIIRLFSPRSGVLVVSDNGPGVEAADEPYIFEAFYSGKGDAGKGLGLYIAREVSARNGFMVEYETPNDDRTLPGATFTLTFSEVAS